MNGFVMWGFWEGADWRADAALFRGDWNIKPNGAMYKRLVFEEWWTRDRRATDSEGRATVRGFLGRYRITARRRDQERTIEANLDSTAGSTVRFVFED